MERSVVYRNPDPSHLWKEGGKGFRSFSVAGSGVGLGVAREDTY